jgi:hypothetical protein
LGTSAPDGSPGGLRQAQHAWQELPIEGLSGGCRIKQPGHVSHEIAQSGERIFRFSGLRRGKLDVQWQASLNGRLGKLFLFRPIFALRNAKQ